MNDEEKQEEIEAQKRQEKRDFESRLEQLQIESTQTLQLIMGLLDQLDENWLEECTEAHNRFLAVGIFQVPPLEYGTRCDELERRSRAARLLLELKKNQGPRTGIEDGILRKGCSMTSPYPHQRKALVALQSNRETVTIIGPTVGKTWLLKQLDGCVIIDNADNITPEEWAILETETRPLRIALRKPPNQLALPDRMKTRIVQGLMVRLPKLTQADRREVAWIRTGSKRWADRIAESVSEFSNLIGCCEAFNYERPMTPEHELAIIDRYRVKPRTVKTLDVTVDEILSAVEKVCWVPRSDIVSKRRTKRLVQARHVAAQCLRSMLGLSLVEVGGILGGRDHSTILNSCNQAGLDDARVVEIYGLLGRVGK